jgi:hypothetical protein
MKYWDPWKKVIHSVNVYVRSTHLRKKNHSRGALENFLLFEKKTCISRGCAVAQILVKTNCPDRGAT